METVREVQRSRSVQSAVIYEDCWNSSEYRQKISANIIPILWSAPLCELCLAMLTYDK